LSFQAKRIRRNEVKPLSPDVSECGESPERSAEEERVRQGARLKEVYAKRIRRARNGLGQAIMLL